MTSPFTSNIGSDTPGTDVATVALSGVSSSNELLAIVVASGSTPPTLTSVIETTTNTALTPLATFSTSKVGGQPLYLGIGVYVLPSPPASPSVTATFVAGVGGQLFLAESTVTGLALDVSGGITSGLTTASISSRFSNELWIAVESYGYSGGGASGPYYDNWTNGFVEEDYSASANSGPSTDWAYLQVSGTDALNVGATISSSTASVNDRGCIIIALKTSASIEAPLLTQINGGLSAPTLGTVTTSTTGGTLGSGQYTYWVTAYDANGETEASNSESVSVASGSTNANSMSWNTVPGAAGYKVYLQDIAPGSLFVSYDVGNVTSFTNTAYDETANGTPTAVATIPTVNTAASTLAGGATAVPVAGGAFDSTLTIALQQNGVSVEQTATYESATTATLDVVTSANGQHLAYSTGVDDPVYPTTAVATTVSGSTGLALPVVLTPAAGLIFQTLGTLHPNPAMRISALPDLVPGDQLEFAGDSSSTTPPPAGTVLHSDGSFEASADIWVRAYIQADAAWTPWVLITVSPEQPGQGFFGGGGV